MTVYPISAPPITPATEEFGLLVKQGVSQSSFTGAATIINNFAQWQLQLGFNPVLRGSTDERAMMGWLVSLRGAQGSFLYYPVDKGLGITGKTVGSQGYAESSSIVITGWSGSAATGLTAGDYFSISNRLFCITSAPVNAASGSATVSFEPPLRADVSAGSTVNFATPRVEMRLMGGDEGQGYSKSADGFTYFKSIVAVEKL